MTPPVPGPLVRVAAAQSSDWRAAHPDRRRRGLQLRGAVRPVEAFQRQARWGTYLPSGGRAPCRSRHSLSRASARHRPRWRLSAPPRPRYRPGRDCIGQPRCPFRPWREARRGPPQPRGAGQEKRGGRTTRRESEQSQGSVSSWEECGSKAVSYLTTFRHRGNAGRGSLRPERALSSFFNRKRNKPVRHPRRTTHSIRFPGPISAGTIHL